MLNGKKSFTAADIQTAVADLPVEVKLMLEEMSYPAFQSAIVNTSTDRLQSAILCDEAGCAWLRAAMMYMDQQSKNFAVLLKEKVCFFLGLASTEYHAYICSNKNTKLDLELYSNFLNLQVKAQLVFDMLSLNDDVSDSVIEVAEILYQHYGAEATCKIVFDIIDSNISQMNDHVYFLYNDVAITYLRIVSINIEAQLKKFSAKYDSSYAIASNLEEYHRELSVLMDRTNIFRDRAHTLPDEEGLSTECINNKQAIFALIKYSDQVLGDHLEKIANQSFEPIKSKPHPTLRHRRKI